MRTKVLLDNHFEKDINSNNRNMDNRKYLVTIVKVRIINKYKGVILASRNNASLISF